MKVSVQQLKNMILKILMEELSQDEIDILEPGNVIIDPDLSMNTVTKVYHGDEGEVENIELVSYGTPAEESDVPGVYKKKVTAEDLKDYEIA